MLNTGHYVQIRVLVFIEDDAHAVSFCEVIFILLFQTINLLQDKQSRMNYSHILWTYDAHTIKMIFKEIMYSKI